MDGNQYQALLFMVTVHCCCLDCFNVTIYNVVVTVLMLLYSVVVLTVLMLCCAVLLSCILLDITQDATGFNAGHSHAKIYIGFGSSVLY